MKCLSSPIAPQACTPAILTQFQLFFANLPVVLLVPCASFSWTRKEFRLKDFTDVLFFSVHPLCKGYETKAKGSLQSGKAPGWESRWVGDTALTLSGRGSATAVVPFWKGDVSDAGMINGEDPRWCAKRLTERWVDVNLIYCATVAKPAQLSRSSLTGNSGSLVST